MFSFVIKMSIADKNSKLLESMEIPDKKNIQMYLTARQFKNSIFEDEIFILPTNKDNHSIPYKMNINDLITVCFKGNKHITRILPYVVNKSFSCELYLKLMLILFDINYDELHGKQRHNLYKLYKKLPQAMRITLFDTYLKASHSKVSLDFFKDEIKKISDIFMQWRYIHEKIDESNTVNIGFLEWICNILDTCSSSLIKTRYQYDVDLDIR